MVETSKFKIGFFVIAGIIACLVVIFLFGGSKIFESKVKLVTVFNESVQGLDVGSQVKFKGVPIGRVKSISITMSNNLIQVNMEINPAAFIGDPSTPSGFFGERSDSAKSFMTFIDGEIKNGLKVRIEYAGITGFKYIEMNYFEGDSGKLLERPDYLSPDEIYIQSQPSIFSDISKNIITSLEHLSKVRFDKISESIESSVAKINTVLGDPAISETLNNIKQITAKVESSTAALSTITPDKVNDILALVDKNLEEYRNLASNLNKNIEKSNLDKTVNSIREATYNISNSSGNLDDTLLKLNKALDNLTTLLERINANPNLLLRGAPKQDIDLAPDK